LSRITSAVAFQTNGRGWLFQAQPLIDGSLQFVDAMEGAATDHAVGDESEQAFDLVEPRTVRECEMKIEAPPLLRL
jgi:hypothetical protein